MLHSIIQAVPTSKIGKLDIIYVTTEDDVHLVKGGIGTAIGLFAKTISDHFPSCRVHWITESPECREFVEYSGSITRYYLNRFRNGTRLPLSEFSAYVDLRLGRLVKAIAADGRSCVVEAPDWEGLAERCFARSFYRNVLKVSRLHTPMLVCGQLNHLSQTLENAEQMRRERAQLLASDLLSAPTHFILNRTLAEVLGTDRLLPPSVVVPNCAPVPESEAPSLNRAQALARLNQIAGLKLRVDDFHVFVIGSLEIRKGAAIVQQAIPALLARFPDCHLTWIGHFSTSEELNANTKISSQAFLDAIPPHLRSRVHLTGYVRHRLLLEVLPAADLYALCYLGDNFPGVLLEIALAGVPMVLLGRGGIPEMIQGPDGLMAFMIEDAADERLPGHFVAAITRARAQPGLARAQAVALRRHVLESFHPIAITSRLLGAYQACSDAKSGQTAT